jgi:hypothetical protein
VKRNFISAASAVALAAAAVPAGAEQINMPGMHKPMASKSAPKTKAAPKNADASKKTSATKKAALASTPSPPPMAGMEMPQTRAKPGAPAIDHSQMNHDATDAMSMPGMTPVGHGADEMVMTGALGSYPMERESSGTSWQPDTSGHMGLHLMSGGWTLMAHGLVNVVYDHQSGPRGNDKALASGMLMGMARRPLGNGALQLRASLSPDPLMGARGYPLLLASGETANGRDRLIDRQHPHDLIMELSGSLSQNLGRTSSVFVYAGLPGEPAFGPPAFMHRESIMDSPEAPISHHWLDSTHISFGVLTAGIVLGDSKIEVSRFNAREPDQHRWNIETGPLDSTTVRLSWNPERTLSLQASWGHFVDPEQLEPGVDQKRLSASAMWADEVTPGWKAAATLAWGRKTAEDRGDDAFAAEGSLKNAGWTLFGRAEVTNNRELTEAQAGPAYRVGKVSIGAIRDFRIADHWSIGGGGLFAVNFVPDALAASYGTRNPTGAMGFVRLKLD